jgi:Legionella pneumophila major outer membrane protein precursor
MKILLTLLALSATTALLADDCCKPCCVPQPRAPICCECYTPAFYEMQCDWGAFATLDFLYWYARESDLSYATIDKTTSLATLSNQPTVTFPVTYKYLDAKWKPGVRVGLGWNTDCDGWDLYVNWTYYKGDAKGSAKAAPFNGAIPPNGQSGVMPLWSQQTMFYPHLLVNSVGAKWQLTFNAIDIEMGRRYYASKCFTLRPYAGLRGAWTRTQFSVMSSNAQTVAPGVPTLAGLFSTLSATDTFSNRNCGVGLLAGFQPVFYFTDEFGFYANADAALLWGKLQNKVRSKIATTFTGGTPGNNFSASAKGNFAGIQPMIDLGVGLRWETYWCQKRYGLEVDAGWEHHMLFAYNYRQQPVQVQRGATSNSMESAFSKDVMSDLAMGGLLLRARFSF